MTNILRILTIAIFCLVTLPGCSGNAEEIEAESTENLGEGNMLRLKRFDVIDFQGFGQPMAVVSFLAPADWRLEGGVQWNFNTECTMEIVSMQARVVSPDGSESFEIFPNFTTFWSQNPDFNQFVGAKGCRVAPPFSGNDFLEKIFLPGFRPKATVAAKEQLSQLAQATHQKQMAIYGELMRQMNSTLQTDAAKVTLKFRGEGGSREEWVVAIVHQSTGHQQDMWGGSYPVYTSEAHQVLAFQAPEGELENRRNLFGTVMGSFRINPAYTQAVRNVRQKMNQQAIQGLINRQKVIQQMNQQVQQSIAANGQDMMDSWKRQSDANDRSHEKWIQMIRGTETYSDPGSPGTSYELSSGYSKVWKTASDEFIMTNDVNFNPNVSLGTTQDWTLMKQQ